jgi:hypothetical protein
MKIYLSGPIGSNIEAARPKFEQAARQVEAFGHQPVNPFSNGLGNEDPWEKHIVADIAMLLSCEGIYLLKGWQGSKGSRIEKNIAEEQEIAIIHQPEI